MLLFVEYFDQQYPIRPTTNRIKDKFDQINGLSLVKTPKRSPKIAGATDAFGPSDTVGVTKIAIQSAS